MKLHSTRLLALVPAAVIASACGTATGNSGASSATHSAASGGWNVGDCINGIGRPRYVKAPCGSQLAQWKIAYVTGPDVVPAEVCDKTLAGNPAWTSDRQDSHSEAMPGQISPRHGYCLVIPNLADLP